jgi:hypothetical protein
MVATSFIEESLPGEKGFRKGFDGAGKRRMTMEIRKSEESKTEIRGKFE